MTQERPPTLSQQVASNVAAWREGSAAETAAAVRERTGRPLTRSTLANIETGRRGELTVEELAALALALDVAPVDLMVPQDRRESVSVAPALTMRSGTARQWFCGTGLPVEAALDVLLPWEYQQRMERLTRHSQIYPGVRAQQHPAVVAAVDLSHVGAMAVLEGGPADVERLTAALERATTYGRLLLDEIRERLDRRAGTDGQR